MGLPSVPAPHPPASTSGAPMYIDDFKQQLPDIDETETREWLESLDQVLDQVLPLLEEEPCALER